jgi:hypothetical protein
MNQIKDSMFVMEKLNQQEHLRSKFGSLEKTQVLRSNEKEFVRIKADEPFIVYNGLEEPSIVEIGYPEDHKN